jgi:hypothetical protein
MGYPFDRLPPSTKENTLQDFLTPNMAAADILIYHKSEFAKSFDKTLKRGHNLFGSYPEVSKVQIKQLRSGGFSGIPDKIQHRLLTIDGAQYFYSYSVQDNFNITVRTCIVLLCGFLYNLFNSKALGMVHVLIAREWANGSC